MVLAEFAVPSTSSQPNLRIYMTSTDIYSPYFYIIKHLPTGKLYAGAKWKKDANPNNFMKPGGYSTSSKYVHKLIEKDGLESFSIIQLLPEKICGIPVIIYETRFLRENNIRSRENWLNTHHNDGAIRFHGKWSEARKEARRIQRTGWKHSPETIRKMTLTLHTPERQESLKYHGKLNRSRQLENPNSKTFLCISPDGICHVVRGSIKQFCVDNNLYYPDMRNCARGLRESHRGWHCSYDNRTFLNE